MDERLGELHTEGVTWAHIRERLADSAIVRRSSADSADAAQNPYALRALRRLKRRTACRMICLTSGNAMFTSAMLENAGGGDVFDDVVGQIATLADDGRVRVSPRSPIDKPHGCDLFCYAGMCKSQALRELVDPDTFDRQIFLGDGVNDWCSVRSLKRSVAVCQCTLTPQRRHRPRPRRLPPRSPDLSRSAPAGDRQALARRQGAGPSP